MVKNNEEKLRKKIKGLECRLKKTRGKVLDKDVVLFHGQLLAKSEYMRLEEFVRSYCCQDLKKEPDILERTRADFGGLGLMYLRSDQYGPSLTLEIKNKHVVAMMVHRGRLGLCYSEEMPEVKENFPYLKKLTIMNMY